MLLPWEHMKRSPTVTCPGPLDDAPVAVTHVSKLNGSSQPSIVMTTGATLYVVKFWEFTGKRTDERGHRIRGDVAHRPANPQWAPILFTDELIDKNPQLWHRNRSTSKGIRPEAGPHFGSSSRLTLSEGENHTYELIPGSWIDRVSNREDFVGALLLDLWTNNCDRCQCVFLSETGSSSLRAVFIDNDHMFGGHFGNEKTCPRRVMVPDARFYRGILTIRSSHTGRALSIQLTISSLICSSRRFLRSGQIFPSSGMRLTICDYAEPDWTR